MEVTRLHRRHGGLEYCIKYLYIACIICVNVVQICIDRFPLHTSFRILIRTSPINLDN